ncbi:MAG: CDP-archaeol synthase [Gammaproteobacteria bacterium]|nr:CDP-archaeol synthase [Gammaproteobacteria bacterium]
MQTLTEILALLLLLLVVNGAPVVATRLLGERLSWPVDGGRCAGDGRRLLGPGKTWRGVFVAVVAGGVLAPVLGWSFELGAFFGLLAMVGDSLSSFVKRRLGLAPSAKASGLDQLPESLLPLLGLQKHLAIGWGEALATGVLFLLVEIGLSRWLYRLHIRRQPH